MGTCMVPKQHAPTRMMSTQCENSTPIARRRSGSAPSASVRFVAASAAVVIGVSDAKLVPIPVASAAAAVVNVGAIVTPSRSTFQYETLSRYGAYLRLSDNN